MSDRESDFNSPKTTVRIVDRLVARHHMDNDRFRQLHHAKVYDNTFRAHRDYAAAKGAFRRGGSNETTARRLYECLLALEAGKSWAEAIASALKKFPR